MAAAWDPGIVGGPYKQSHIRLCDWKDLYRKTEKCLRSGAELLFLPRGKRGLSHWVPSGCDRKLELQDGILCSWLSDLCGSAAWKTGVRISLPIWTDPGSVEQDSFSKEDPDISGRQAFEKTEICDLSCICDPTSNVCSRYHGPGSTIFLQADLPGRNAGGRYPAGAAEQIHAKCSRLAVHVEKYDPGDHHYLINYDIPAIL